MARKIAATKGEALSIALRPGTPADADACGVIAFEAFKSISSQHNFPWDFPSPDIAVGLMKTLLAHPGFYSVVAEEDGKIVGSNFVDERGVIAGIGPITVDPAVQNRSIGRRLMQAIIEREAERRRRRGQAAAIGLSQPVLVPLYQARLRQPRAVLENGRAAAERDASPAIWCGRRREPDLPACNALCRRVHGHDRDGELRDAIRQGTARVVEHLGQVTAYASEIAFFGHAVAETNQGLQALIGAATGFDGGGFLLPTRNGELFRWCLEHGLRLVHQMTLMTIGLYNEPAGAYLPSVSY